MADLVVLRAQLSGCSKSTLARYLLSAILPVGPPPNRNGSYQSLKHPPKLSLLVVLFLLLLLGFYACYWDSRLVLQTTQQEMDLAIL